MSADKQEAVTDEGTEPEAKPGAEKKQYDLKGVLKELVEKDPETKEALAEIIEQKRSANSEAAKYRKKLERIESEQKKREEEEAKQRGEYERLYQEAQTQLEQERARNKDILLQSELKVLASKAGIRKMDYLKLFDASDVEVGETGVIGLEDKFEAFKEANPDLFKGDIPRQAVTEGRPESRRPGEVADKEIEAARRKAMQTGNKTDLLRYKALRKRQAERN